MGGQSSLSSSSSADADAVRRRRAVRRFSSTNHTKKGHLEFDTDFVHEHVIIMSCGECLGGANRASHACTVVLQIIAFLLLRRLRVVGSAHAEWRGPCGPYVSYSVHVLTAWTSSLASLIRGRVHGGKTLKVKARLSDVVRD